MNLPKFQDDENGASGQLDHSVIPPPTDSNPDDPSKMSDEVIQRKKLLASIIFDGSSLDLYGTCPRKYYFHHELGLAPRREALPLTYGGALHEGLYRHYLGRSMSEVLNAFAMRAADPRSQIPLSIDDAIKDKSNYSIEYGIYLLQRYVKRFPPEKEIFTPVTDVKGKPYLEMGFALDTGSGLFYGRLDGIVRMKEDNGLYLLEHKHTMKVINETYWKQFRMSNQITRYLWAVWQIMGEEPKGCIVNVLRTYPFKREPKEGLEENVFQRMITSRTMTQMEAMSRQTDWQIALIQHSRKYGIDAFFMNAPDACNQYFRDCDYMPLCRAAHPAVFDAIRKGEYVDNTWRPYEAEEHIKETLQGIKRFFVIEAEVVEDEIVDAQDVKVKEESHKINDVLQLHKEKMERQGGILK